MVTLGDVALVCDLSSSLGVLRGGFGIPSARVLFEVLQRYFISSG